MRAGTGRCATRCCASTSAAAMAQLVERRYADKYRALGEPIFLIGVEFSREARNLVSFEGKRA